MKHEEKLSANVGKKILVVVDVQNDFVKGGVLAYGFPQKSNTESIVAYAKHILDGGNYIIATRDTHHDNYFDTLEGKNLPIKHCIHQTKGWELVDGLKELFYKGQIFDKPTFGTPLVAEQIRSIMEYEDIDEIQLVGYDLSICVLANAVLLRAHFPNKQITVIPALCGDVDKKSFDAAIAVLRNQQIEIADSI